MPRSKEALIRDAELARQRARKQKQRRRELVYTYKDAPCADCLVKYPPAVMDLHHEDPSSKEDNLSAMVRRNASIESIIAECKKCVPLCPTCHRLRHYYLEAAGPGDDPGTPR